MNSSVITNHRSYTPSLSRTAEAIFVVGVSRSGTTLMWNILNASDKIALAWENNFFGHIIGSEGARHRFRKFGNLSDDNNVHKLVDYIYSDEFKKSSRFRNVSRHWRWIVEKINKEDFLERLLKSDRSERALFTVMMQVFAVYENKPIIGEKTPIHFRYVSQILEWFANGRIIHMIRDPRAIFVSELRRRRKAKTPPYKQLRRFELLYKFFILLQTTILWFESTYRCSRYKKIYPGKYYSLRFEDLVKDPENHIRQLCNFLGVDFQEKMLEQSVPSGVMLAGFLAGQKGFDTQAADRWRQHIDPWINFWFVFWFRKYLREFGYVDKPD